MTLADALGLEPLTVPVTMKNSRRYLRGGKILKRQTRGGPHSVCMHGLIASLMLFAASAGAAEYYDLPSVKRIEANLYRSGSLLIETRYCYHYAHGEPAVLKYEGPGRFTGTKIIWDDDSPCEVIKLTR